MRFLALWAYFASPWLWATCHKALRNIGACRGLIGGSATARGMLFLGVPKGLITLRSHHRPGPANCLNGHSVPLGTCPVEREEVG